MNLILKNIRLHNDCKDIEIIMKICVRCTINCAFIKMFVLKILCMYSMLCVKKKFNKKKMS